MFVWSDIEAHVADLSAALYKRSQVSRDYTRWAGSPKVIPLGCSLVDPRSTHAKGCGDDDGDDNDNEDGNDDAEDGIMRDEIAIQGIVPHENGLLAAMLLK